MKVQIKGLGEVGLVADQEPYELVSNALSDLQNMRMRAGWAERVRGHRQAGDNLSFVPYALFPYMATEAKYVIEAGLRDISVFDGSTRTAASPPALTMTAADKWTGDFLGGFQILNNQADVPLSWSGSLSDDFVALAGWTSTHRARAMRVLRYHLVAVNITKDGVNHPHRVKISAGAEPGFLPPSWDETDPKVDTDEFDVKGDGVLVDALLMGDTLNLYKGFSVAALRYSRSNESAWACEPLPFKLGMMSQNCGVAVPGVGHVVLTKGDVVRFDGNSVDSIVDGRNRDWLFDHIDENHFANSFVCTNDKYSEVWICFPERGSEVCTKALVWNYRSNVISKRDLPNVTCACPGVITYAIDTYDSDAATFNSETTLTFDSGDESIATNATRLLMGTTASELLIMDSGDSADGLSFSAYVERTGLNDLQGMLDRVKHCRGIWLNVDAAPGVELQVSIGSADDAKAAPVYEDAITFTVGTDQWIDAWTTGRYLAYKIAANGGDFWRIRALTLDIEDAGQY